MYIKFIYLKKNKITTTLNIQYLYVQISMLKKNKKIEICAFNFFYVITDDLNFLCVE